MRYEFLNQVASRSAFDAYVRNPLDTVKAGIENVPGPAFQLRLCFSATGLVSREYLAVGMSEQAFRDLENLLGWRCLRFDFSSRNKLFPLSPSRKSFNWYPDHGLAVVIEDGKISRVSLPLDP